MKMYFKKGKLPIYDLPEKDFSPNGRIWTDLKNNPDGLKACGYKETPKKPDAPEGKYVDWNIEKEDWEILDLPTPEPIEEPQPVLKIIGRLEFILLCQEYGGMTDKMLVDAKNDPAFEEFWLKFSVASQVDPNNDVTKKALQALEYKKYLPEGAQKVLDSWPTE